MAEEKKAAALAQFYININGSVPHGLMDNLVEAVIDTNLHLPSMFSVQVHDKQLTWMDQIEIGQEVEISAKGAEQAERSGTEAPLFKGEITALEAEFGEKGEATLIIRGYTRDHRLHRGKNTRSFLKMSDADIVQQIAGEAGLQAQVDAPAVQYEYVLQNNQTNFEFLLARAQRIGCQLYVEGETLHFRKADSQGESGPTLSWGGNLRYFRPRITSAQQDSEVLVQGWDPKTKQKIIGRATTGDTLTPKVQGVGGTGPDIAKKFGEAKTIVVQRPVISQEEADKIAQALADEISGNFIRAEGRCFGEAGVNAGKMVTLASVGPRFDGQYLVTSATHIYSPEEGYETVFTINGAKADTLSHLLDPSLGSLGAHDAHTRINGVVIGMVTNNEDPEKYGRVKVKFPWLTDEDESNWARIASPMAGPERGFFYLPEVNDEVLVAFEHGDMNYPYIVGALWNGKDKLPPEASDAVSGGKVNKRLIKTRSGHQILLVDESGKEKIHIIDSTENNEILIDSAKNEMSFKVDGKFSIEAKGEVTIKSDSEMSLESKGMKIKGGQSVTVKGQRIELN